MVKKAIFIKKEETADLIAMVDELIARYPQVTGEQFLSMFGRWNKTRARNILQSRGKIAKDKDYFETEARVDKYMKILGMKEQA